MKLLFNGNYIYSVLLNMLCIRSINCLANLTRISLFKLIDKLIQTNRVAYLNISISLCKQIATGQPARPGLRPAQARGRAVPGRPVRGPVLVPGLGRAGGGLVFCIYLKYLGHLGIFLGDFRERREGPSKGHSVPLDAAPL